MAAQKQRIGKYAPLNVDCAASNERKLTVNTPLSHAGDAVADDHIVHRLLFDDMHFRLLPGALGFDLT